MNHYGYCFGNPVGFSDKNGKWPGWMEDAWDIACDVAGDLKDVASDAWDSTCDFAGDVYDAASDFVNENKEVIVATAAAGVAMATAVAKYGVVGGIGAGVCILAGGVAMASIAYQKGEDVGSAFSRGIADTSIIITATALNPIGAAKGMGTQAIVDLFMAEFGGGQFDLDSYAAAAVGGALGDYIKDGGGVEGGLASSITNAFLKFVYSDEDLFSVKNILNTAVAALLGVICDLCTTVLEEVSIEGIKKWWDMFTKPLWFLKDYTTETNVNTWIDGYLRALFGVNDGTSVLTRSQLIKAAPRLKERGIAI